MIPRNLEYNQTFKHFLVPINTQMTVIKLRRKLKKGN